MGQEDYLNNLLNSLEDNEEHTNTTADKKMDNLSAHEEDYENYFQESEFQENLTQNSNETIENEHDEFEIDNNEEQDVNLSSELEDIFASTEEEPMGDIFASTEEEPMGDIFASTEEEPMGDIFASTEEESMGDIFASTEEEPMGDIFASTEEEQIGDIFSSTEEEQVGDIFSSTEEEPIGDIFSSTEEEPIGDMSENTEENAMLNDIDNLLSGVDEIGLDEENETKFEETNQLEEEPESISSSQDTGEQFDEEDIFSMFSAGEEQEDSNLDETNDGPMDSKSLFDDDLMKLLGEEDLSTEDIIGGSDEEEMLQALKNGNFGNSDTKVEEKKDKKENKKAKKGGIFSKFFKNGSDSSTDKSAEENDGATKEVNKKDKKKNTDKKDKKAKAKKEKKPKKEKTSKNKKPPKPVIIEEPTPPLHKGTVIAIFILFLSIGAFVIFGSNIVPYSINLNSAERYYEREQYELALNEMQGLSVKEKDLTFYRKLELIMILKNQLNEYQTFDSLSLKPEALHSLLRGVAKYDEHYAKAQQYGIEGKYDTILEQMTNEMSNKFGVSIDTARTMNALATREEYSAQVYSITK